MISATRSSGFSLFDADDFKARPREEGGHHCKALRLGYNDSGSLALTPFWAVRVFFVHQEVDQDQDDHDRRDVHAFFSFPRLLSRGGFEKAYAPTSSLIYRQNLPVFAKKFLKRIVLTSFKDVQTMRNYRALISFELSKLAIRFC